MSDIISAFQDMIDTAVDKALQKHIDEINHKTSLLRVSQIAKKYHVSDQTVHNWISQGLRVYQPSTGGVILIDEDVLIEWIKGE